MKDYFSGASPIVSGELGEDFTSIIMLLSEQTPSSVGLGVLVNLIIRLKQQEDLSFKGYARC